MFRNAWFHGAWIQQELPLECVADGSAPGRVDEAVACWVDRLQFDGPAWLIRRHLRGYGAWSRAELCDHQANLQRLLWIWAGHCRDGGVVLVLE